ncbi:MAG: 50S ribosomal protein L35 [Myxococcota bacterium]
MKTKRAAAKRLRTTAKGKIRRASAGKSHLMRGKSSTRLRPLKKHSLVSKSEEKNLRQLIPYKF